MIELETGAMKDGTLVARRARLILDNGAYSADAPFFPQLAAMIAVGPYKVPNVFVDASLAYTNTTPSGSVRAPTAPQACWAVEQHMDSVADQLGIDPLELRRKNVVREGDEGPTRQVFDPIGAAETLEKAAEMIGYGRELPDDEAIGIACGWWPSFSIASGAYVKLNADGSGTIVTGAQECGTGAVMALPLLAAEVLGMQPDDFSVLYQDTDAGPFDSGASGSQTTFNNGRAVVEGGGGHPRAAADAGAEDALEASRADLELADGTVRVKGSPTKSVSITVAVRDGPGRPAPARPRVGQLRLRCPRSTPPAAPAGWGWSRSSRRTFITHAVRCKVDRETGVVRVLEVAAAHDSGKVLNPIGARGQAEGGVVMGIGMATLGGLAARRATAASATRTCSTTSSRPAPTRRRSPSTGCRSTRPRRGRSAPRGSASRRASRRRARSATRSPRSTGARVHRLPMTPERVWEAMQA